MAGDWPRSFFWRFHGSRLCLALLTSRLVNIAYMIILRCLCNIVKENERTTKKAKSIFVLEIFKYLSFWTVHESIAREKSSRSSCLEKPDSLKYSLRSSVPFVIILRNSRVLRALWWVKNFIKLINLYLIEFLFFFFLYIKVITRLAGMEEVPINVDSITMITFILIALLFCNRGQGEGRDMKWAASCWSCRIFQYTFRNFMGDLDFSCPLFVTTFDISLICNVCCFAPYKTIVNLIFKKNLTLWALEGRKPSKRYRWTNLVRRWITTGKIHPDFRGLVFMINKPCCCCFIK